MAVKWRGRERDGHCPIRMKERGRVTNGREEPGWKGEKEEMRGREPSSSTRMTRTNIQSLDAYSVVLPANLASPPPPNNSTSSQLPFPPKLDSSGSPIHGEPTPSSPACPRTPTTFSSISKANSNHHHHYQWTPCEPRNMSQALVGTLELRNCRIESHPILGFHTILAKLESF